MLRRRDAGLRAGVKYGPAWGAETVLLVRGTTALDVIEFEEPDLGNGEDFKHLGVEIRGYLAGLPSSYVER